MRRQLSLWVSVALVVVLGLAGLWAGHSAGATAEATHRSDRLALQVTLAGLAGQYSQVSAAEILDIVAAQARSGASTWTLKPGSAADAARLRVVAENSRALGAGAVLVAPGSGPVNTYVPAGRVLPSPSDPGWAPLRAAAASGRRTVPVSGVLQAGSVPVVAVGVPITVRPGVNGLIIGLSDLRQGALQRYVATLKNPDGRRGYVVDGRGLVIAGPSLAEVGRPLRLAHVWAAVTGRTQGIRDVKDGGTTYVASYAAAGTSGWVAMTVQDADHFLGPLRRSALRAEVALVALLLFAGVALLLLHRKREAALRDAAVTDELTGLLNRRGWHAVAAHEIERARRSGESRGLLFFDVDGLKQVNDRLGHREGDRAIVDAAAVLRSVARSSDVLGRLGGDEFALMLGDAALPDVVRGRVQEALRLHNLTSTARFELRLSAGTEVWGSDDACTLDVLLQRADEQMYVDKKSRPSRHEGLLREKATSSP
jgi:diguanylate cyclase (GGDEF)-like protein